MTACAEMLALNAIAMRVPGKTRSFSKDASGRSSLEVSQFLYYERLSNGIQREEGLGSCNSKLN